MKRLLPVALAVAALSLALLITADPAHGEAPAATFSQCAFVQGGWLEGQAPKGVPKSFEHTATIPEGWTVVGGNMGTAPAILVCR